MTVQQAARYARDELDVCAERSKRRWMLDLTLLEREFGVDLPAPGASRGGSGWLRKLVGVSR
jgi:hypothetical protein